MKFNPGFEIRAERGPMGFVFGPGVFGPAVERRSLNSIRQSLMDPNCDGPEDVYCIAMDVGLEEDKADLISRQLLYGAVTYASGKLGKEPVRSQGHIHAISASCGASTCEVYEIWEGSAAIYMQPNGGDDAGICYAVFAGPGEVVIVPPGWVHATINADPNTPMTFGAWCVRDYGFDYADVRRHGGIAFFPWFDGDTLKWRFNERYRSGELVITGPRAYTEFGLDLNRPIYTQYRDDHALFAFVTQPGCFAEQWKNFRP